MTMKVSYEEANAVVRKHKGALTRARKRGPEAVVAACDAAFAAFDGLGVWPDGWATWEVAKGDAQMAILRAERGL